MTRTTMTTMTTTMTKTMTKTMTMSMTMTMTRLSDFVGKRVISSKEGFVVAKIHPALLMRLRSIRELRDGYALIKAADEGTASDERKGAKLVQAFSPKAEGTEKRLRITSSTTKKRITHFEAGFYLHFDRIETFIAPIREICSELARDLGLSEELVTASAFVTNTPNAAAAHVDPVTTLHVQLVGRKTWWLAPAPTAAKRFPLSIEEAQLPNSTMTQRFDLEPGSVVFLPPGCIHATKTEGPSLGVLFTVSGESAADRIAKEAARRLLEVEALRAPSLYRRQVIARSNANALAAKTLHALADELERESFT